MTDKTECHARQCSDQMVCDVCGARWDMNDPEPPQCLRTPPAQEAQPVAWRDPYNSEPGQSVTFQLAAHLKWPPCRRPSHDPQTERLEQAMSVYVDDMCDTHLGAFGRMKMSHMIADTTEELLVMADRIGVARKWIQYPGTDREHFDIAKSKRAAAIAAGAIPMSMRELALTRKAISAARNQTGVNDDPT